MAKQLDENTSMGLDLDGDGKTDVKISIKTIGAIVFGIVSLAGVWFTLKQDIAEAKELPKPVIDRVEYDLKDELIRQTIMDTQEDVEEIKESLEKIDERLYELQKNR
jgi:copper chaperone CopZ|tara:strand:+ start:237 stop:557 length:321 start_codon:yes stop_codon:yes gene_type:complete